VHERAGTATDVHEHVHEHVHGHTATGEDPSRLRRIATRDCGCAAKLILSLAWVVNEGQLAARWIVAVGIAKSF
jgi:hypothetical protein